MGGGASALIDEVFSDHLHTAVLGGRASSVQRCWRGSPVEVGREQIKDDFPTKAQPQQVLAKIA